MCFIDIQNVERPYKHAFRDDSDEKANKHSLSQLAPTRLHGAAYLRAMKREAQGRNDQGAYTLDEANSQDNLFARTQRQYATNSKGKQEGGSHGGGGVQASQRMRSLKQSPSKSSSVGARGGGGGIIDTISVNSSVSGVLGDMENIEFKPQESQNKFKKDQMEALLLQRQTSGRSRSSSRTDSRSNSRNVSRSNSLVPQKRFSSLLNEHE